MLFLCYFINGHHKNSNYGYIYKRVSVAKWIACLLSQPETARSSPPQLIFFNLFFFFQPFREISSRVDGFYPWKFNIYMFFSWQKPLNFILGKIQKNTQGKIQNSGEISKGILLTGPFQKIPCT